MGRSAHRFLITYRQNGFGEEIRILVDRETGVNYLMQILSNGGSGITPLLGRDGKPIISPISGEEN